MEFFSELRRHFPTLFYDIDSQRSRSFLGLLFAGQYGAQSASLNQLFRSLGILHLLVLSGSQTQHLSSAVNCGLACIPRLRGDKFRLARFLLLPLIWICFLLFAQCPPPLVRATLFSLVSLFASRLRQGWTLLFCFFAQILLFPDHLQSRSFYLSWLCFLTLFVFSALRLAKVFLMIAVAVVAQLIVILVIGSEWPGWRDWLWAIISNIFWILIFENWLFPLGALVFISYLGLALGAVLVLGHMTFPDFYLEGVKRILSGLSALILGALEGFMYTSKYDL